MSTTELSLVSEVEGTADREGTLYGLEGGGGGGGGEGEDVGMGLFVAILGDEIPGGERGKEKKKRREEEEGEKEIERDGAGAEGVS